MDQKKVDRLMRQYVLAHPSIARTKKEYQLETHLRAWDEDKDLRQNSDACKYRSISAAAHLASIFGLKYHTNGKHEEEAGTDLADVFSKPEWKTVRNFMIAFFMKPDVRKVVLEAFSRISDEPVTVSERPTRQRKASRRGYKMGPRHSDDHYRQHWKSDMTIKGLVRLFRVHPVTLMKKSKELGLPYKRTKRGEKRLATLMLKLTKGSTGVPESKSQQVVETV